MTPNAAMAVCQDINRIRWFSILLKKDISIYISEIFLYKIDFGRRPKKIFIYIYIKISKIFLYIYICKNISRRRREKFFELIYIYIAVVFFKQTLTVELGGTRYDAIQSGFQRPPARSRASVFVGNASPRSRNTGGTMRRLSRVIHAVSLSRNDAVACL